MNQLRINLHIRSDVSPDLYAALSKLPPRPRAEYLRKLAESALLITRTKQIQEQSVPSQQSDAHAADQFNEDLHRLLGNS